MADIDLQIVREFFEINQFLVATHWPQHDPDDRADGSAQLYVQNTATADRVTPDIVLDAGALRSIARAVIEVHPWHTDRFYASLIDANPVLTEFAEPGALGRARDFFGTDDFATVLVVSQLPRTPEQRQQVLTKLAQTRVQHLIEFPLILNDLTERVMLSGTYTGSTMMQVLQLLKRYRLFRNQQLEFLFPHPSHTSESGRRVNVDLDPGASEE